MKRDDTLWKAILEDLFDDFLVFFFKEDAKLFDLDRGFEFLDKELEQLFPTEGDLAHPKFVDKLVKVFTKDGREEWVLVHVEVQGYKDADFAKRMFTYFYRIYDRYNKPVTCIAIFTDGNKNFRPAEFNYNFLGTKNNFSFNTYKIIDQDEDELRKSNNPFAIVILTVLIALQKGKVVEEELLTLKNGLLKALFRKEMLRSKILSLMTFLRLYVRFENAQIIAKFDYEIDLITDKHNTMGIVEFVLERAKNEGVETTEARKDAAFVKSLLIQMEGAKKDAAFVESLLIQTDFSVERIAQIAYVTVAFVEEVKASLSK